MKKMMKQIFSSMLLTAKNDMTKLSFYVLIILILNNANDCYSINTDDIQKLQDDLTYYKQLEADQEIQSKTRADEINAAFISSGIFVTIEKAGNDIREMKEAVITSSIRLKVLSEWRFEKDKKDRDQDVTILANRNNIERYSIQKEISEAERRGNIKSIISGIFGIVTASLIFLWKLYMIRKKKRNQSQNNDFENEEILN